MVMPIRRTLPTLAAAVAFALTGCSSDDGGSSSDSDSASEEQTPSTEATKDQDGAQGEEGAPSGDDEQGDATDGAEQSEADAPGSGPSTGDLYGYWTTQSSGDTASVLIFYGDKVLFVENFQPGGDTCDGTYADGRMTVECARGGDSGWKDTEATVAITHSPKNIDVTWGSGTTLSFNRTDESPNGVPEYPRKQVPEIDAWLNERNTN